MSRLVNVTNLSPCAPVAVCDGAVAAADQSASSPERMPPPLPPAEASGASVDKENPLTLATVVPPLTLREYGACAMRTAVYPGIGNNVPYAALGLVGEAGEVQKRTKRALPFNQTAPPLTVHASRLARFCRVAVQVADKVKKVMRDGDGNFGDAAAKAALVKELGDVLWYAAALAQELGTDLEVIQGIFMMPTCPMDLILN